MIDTLGKLFKDFAETTAERTALLCKDKSGVFQPINWKDFYNCSKQFGAGLLSLGVQRGSHIGVISDNRKEWIMADFGILCIGCSDVPRGSDSMPNEIEYILKHADCAVSLAENSAQLDKLISIKDSLPALERIIVMDEDFVKTESNRQAVDIVTFKEILAIGEKYLAANPDCFEQEIEKSKPEDLATIIYTSGTTGEPKGVMLSHANYMHQIKAARTPIDIGENDVVMSVLPVWHSFERAVEYVILFAGCVLAYSKPISQVLREDFIKLRPTVMPSVPRIWERFREAVYKTVIDEGGIRKALFLFFVAAGSVHSKLWSMFRGLKAQYKRRFRPLDMLISFLPLLLITPLNLLGQLLVFSKIKARLGGRFRFGVSGGGALPPHVDDFFAAAGVLLLEGYGLTETSPIVSVRDCRRPVPGTIGPALPQLEIKVTDEQGNSLSPGQKGVLHIKGPNIMQGYYKKPEETAKTINAEGWLDSGDLAILTHKGEIKILGRVKETIVLTGGENVEPGPIEDVINESNFIGQTMVVGQDQHFLAALVVPNFENLENYAKEYGIATESHQDLIDNEDIQRLILGEINQLVSPKRGFKLFERINRVKLRATAFEEGKELTHTLKIKRSVVSDLYRDEIKALFGAS